MMELNYPNPNAYKQAKTKEQANGYMEIKSMTDRWKQKMMYREQSQDWNRNYFLITDRNIF